MFAYVTTERKTCLFHRGFRNQETDLTDNNSLRSLGHFGSLRDCLYILESQRKFSMVVYISYPVDFFLSPNGDFTHQLITFQAWHFFLLKCQNVYSLHEYLFYIFQERKSYTQFLVLYTSPCNQALSNAFSSSSSDLLSRSANKMRKWFITYF